MDNQDLEDLLHSRLGYVGKDGNSGPGSWYHEVLASNPQLKEYLVKADPDLAVRQIGLFKDRELARLFLLAHLEDEQLHHTVYFVSQFLGTPIERRPVVMEGTLY